MREYRNLRQISTKDLATQINEMFGPGYNASEQKLFAIEAGITKSVPLWVVIGYMQCLGLDSADRLFTFVGV